MNAQIIINENIMLLEKGDDNFDHSTFNINNLIARFNPSVNEPLILRSFNGIFFLIDLLRGGGVSVHTNLGNGLVINSDSFRKAQEVTENNLSHSDLLELMSSQDNCYQSILQFLCLKYPKIDQKVKSFINYK